MNRAASSNLRRRHQAAVTQLVGQVEENAGEVRLVFDHQDAAVTERRSVTVVGEGQLRQLRRLGSGELRYWRQGYRQPGAG